MANLNRTFKELQDAVKTEMQLDPGLISDLERKTFINNCIKDLSTIGLFEKSATLSVVNGKAELPDDLITIVDVTYNNRFLIPVKRMRSITGDSPIGYIINYNNIEIFPQASGDIELYYAYKPAMLVADEDKPDIPNGYDQMLVDWSVGHAHRKNGNIGLYREYMGAYNEGKVLLVNELTKRYNSRVTTQHNAEYMETPATPFDFI